ncbi:hypothetical protein [Corynebacterium guaraldiae]|uniref:hypothetical protein n=1 Tax=Corynebacterium guaraldiae TaxID=3051103 RepID=UPI00163D882D|nr:hypothetical protein [Corynebacterium guaraldiae]
MPRIMYKPRTDRNEYIIWSTVVDLPMSWVLDRDTAKETWRAGGCSILGTPISEEQAEESMVRADTKGWSLIDGEPGEYELLNLANIEYYPGPYDSGVCRVADLAPVTRAIEAEDWDALHQLLTELSTVEDK